MSRLLMTKHPRYQHSLDDLFLHVYVFVDDWLELHGERYGLREQRTQVASYSELFTIALVGELVAQPYESIWYWLVQQNHRDLFPKLPEYSRYHRVVRNAEGLWAELALYIARRLPDSQRKLIDAKPLPVAKGKRAAWAKLPEARKGFSTMGMVYGFKLHAVVSERGLFEKWLFAPADVHEVPAAKHLIEHLEGKVIAGDKAYIGVEEITKPKRSNMKKQDPGWTKALARARKRIETSFSVLVRSLTLHVAQVKTFWSLRAKVNLKIAAHNLIHSGLLNG